MTDVEDQRIHWDKRHGDLSHQPRAAEVLTENRYLLPDTGKALDLACGLGGNAILLSEQGLEVTAWDLSRVAIERLTLMARLRELKHLQAAVYDVEREPLPISAFDVITVSYYLNRDIASPLIGCLKPGGLLFYQTFTRQSVGGRGPSNPDYRLEDNELLRLFKPLSVCFYREERKLGDIAIGIRDVAMLVAQKPVE